MTPFSNSFQPLPPLKDTGLCDHVHVSAKCTERKMGSSIHQIQIAETRTFLAPSLGRGLTIESCGTVNPRAVIPIDDTSG